MAEITANKTDLSVLPGNEKTIPYSINPPAEKEGRWSYAWNAFKRSLGPFIWVNLLMLVFFAPIVVAMYLRSYTIGVDGVFGPFGDNLAVGYPALPVMSGLAEALYLKNDVLFFSIVVAASLFAAVGVSGGLYSARKILRSEERWKLTDFFVGVVKGYFPALLSCLLCTGTILLSVFVFDYAALATAQGGSVALWVVLRIAVCLFSVVVALFALWLLCLTTNYKQNFKGAVKNSFALGFGSILPSLFFLAMAFVPIVFLVWQAMLFIGLLFYILFGFAYVVFVWASFSDWVFDHYASYTAVKTQQQEAERKKRLEEEDKGQDVYQLLLVGGKSEYLSRAVLPLSSGTDVCALANNFGAEDLQLLKESREKIASECAAYAAAHAQEEKYVQYNARFADREKALPSGKGRKKKFDPTMLG